MKTIIVIIFTLIGSTSFSQTRFGVIKDNKIMIVVDTLKFKTYLYDNLYEGNTQKVNLEKIEVRKQNLLGLEQEFYFVSIHDFKKNITIVKWLSREGNDLILSNNLNSEDLFESYFVVCTGKENCLPNVAVLDGRKVWICGESLQCSIPDSDKKPTCAKSTAMTENNF